MSPAMDQVRDVSPESLHHSLQTAYRRALSSLAKEFIGCVESHLVMVTCNTLLPLLCRTCQHQFSSHSKSNAGSLLAPQRDCTSNSSETVSHHTPLFMKRPQSPRTAPQNATTPAELLPLWQDPKRSTELYKHAESASLPLATNTREPSMQQQNCQATGLSASRLLCSPGPSRHLVTHTPNDARQPAECSAGSRSNTASKPLLHAVQHTIKRRTGWVSKKEPLQNAWLTEPTAEPRSSLQAAERDGEQGPTASRGTANKRNVMERPPPRRRSTDRTRDAFVLKRTCHSPPIPKSATTPALPPLNTTKTLQQRTECGTTEARPSHTDPRACSQCEDFYAALSDVTPECGKKNASHQLQRSSVPEFSKHRYYGFPPPTPAGFWDIEFPDKRDVHG